VLDDHDDNLLSTDVQKWLDAGMLVGSGRDDRVPVIAAA
jgi:hypothetical protein